MAITPNTNFTAGAILTATQQNNFPRGIMAIANSTANYALTTVASISTGMTVTFTAVASRNYRVTYYEPQATTSTVLDALTNTQIRLTNAAGTLLQTAYLQNDASNDLSGTLTNTYVGTFTAGSVTIVGCSLTSNVTGAPNLIRNTNQPAQIIVEDIGTA